LSVEDLEGTKLKISEWESELWSYVSMGDGMHCPLYNHCPVRLNGGWCADDHRKQFNQLLDEQFHFSDYDCRKCETCGRIFTIVERLAQKYLKKGKASRPPVPTEIVSLADEQHTIEFRQVPLKVYHGAIWYMKDGWIIQLKDNDQPATKRFTLFHEAFHILAHCQTTPVFRKIGSDKGFFNELLADYFATCILMPRQWVQEKWAEVEDLDRIVEVFDVPKPAMYFRLKHLCLI
jgi:hypothetical protein